MQEKMGANFFIEVLAVVAILSALSAIAIPNVGQLISKGRLGSYKSEFQNIQTAVIEMFIASVAQR